MEYKSSLRGLAVFELKSWLGRMLLSTSPQLKKADNYLNLGCGGNIIDGYINADFFYRFKFWKKDEQKKQWQLDLRYRLNCDDDVFDGIFTEHTLEHLYPDDAASLLAELYRVLKPDSIIRITVPDIEKYIYFYNKKYENIDVDEFKERYQTGCSAIRNTTQNYFHFSAWDFNELKKYLENVGFKNVQRKEFSITQDSKLNLDLKDRSWETLYVEAVK